MNTPLTLLLLAAAASVPQQREPLATYTRDAAVRLEASLDGVTGAQSRFKPSPEAWSVLETIEHIIKVETALLGVVRGQVLDQGNRKPAPEGTPPAAAIDEQIRTGFTDRSTKAKSPEAFLPTAAYPDLAAAREAFRKVRAETMRLIESSPADFRAYRMKHPVGFDLDAHQWLLTIAAHGERHRLQIEEVKANPACPR